MAKLKMHLKKDHLFYVGKCQGKFVVFPSFGSIFGDCPICGECYDICGTQGQYPNDHFHYKSVWAKDTAQAIEKYNLGLFE